MARARRSGRLSGARTKYTDDPFELAGISGESGSEDQEKRSASKGERRAARDDSSDEDFAESGDDVENYEDEEDDDNTEADVGTSPPGTEVFDEDEEMIDGDERPVRKVVSARNFRSKKRKPDGAVDVRPEDTHSRGIWNATEHVGKSTHIKLVFGTDDRDRLAMAYARDRWFRGIDSGFPTRTSLDEAQTMSSYGYGPTFGIHPDDAEREATTGWDWYYQEDIGGRFRKRQRVEKIQEEDARSQYLPRAGQRKHTVMVGPTDARKTYELGQFEVLNFGDAWGEAKARNKKGAATSEDSESRASSSRASAASDKSSGKKKMREGWILNLGNKIQCLAWAPNQSGLTQYLAIVVPITQEQKDAYPKPTEPKGAPAFTPSEGTPAALQIWAFKARKGDSFTRELDTSVRPKLRMVICTDWGDLRRIHWCQMPRQSREEDDEDVSKNLGLLAGVWADGRVRVLDIKLSRNPDSTEFYKMHSPAFESKPPSTICTCMTWLSPTDIAVGCANGFLAVWSILPAQDEKPGTEALPYIYQRYHTTYVLSVDSAYPTHAHLVATTSMDGETRLSSLLDHQKDTVETTRMRMGSAQLSYSPFLQAFFSSDENDFARLLAVRRFFSTTAVARLPSTVTALAQCSSWHPSALLGCASGSVIAANPLRRLLYAKEKHWQQTWFAHEWVSGKSDDSSGISRFHDGFKAESVSLLRNLMGDRKLINGTMIITIYDEPTHVTALSWNLNQRCAGWASAGMGCGLVRVEDLAM
ncbi:putative transcription factor TFIIIC complex subunit Tfc6 [Paecilomyces variotii]|uniref:Putative transcription factor TFIIIC complex subunit Tfc6 n=1 Tax=Byssochlamys spectabilis TaxID=264951 RepID=A0A443I5A9_BYSSP|nr:putative transcription factor TFIIIC complex subunit Tfc6 [Paecilomyces variotii]KAJ9352736.1 hypothetical protein DTO280E4_7629 [Paecilomyces variotii]RWQ99278.1 putative transcription factor TFIIIC complex subunit Tfc6 [Paecilomyces variotii]